MTKTDPALEAIRRVRHEISREHDNDPGRLVEHYMALQRRVPSAKLIQGPNEDGEVATPDSPAAHIGR
jgi:hypothetical protein